MPQCPEPSVCIGSSGTCLMNMYFGVSKDVCDYLKLASLSSFRCHVLGVYIAQRMARHYVGRVLEHSRRCFGGDHSPTSFPFYV
jgi:hypothetical protein